MIDRRQFLRDLALTVAGVVAFHRLRVPEPPPAPDLFVLDQSGRAWAASYDYVFQRAAMSRQAFK